MSELRKIMVPRGHSIVTAKLIEMLETGKVGDVLTDEAMSAAVGVDCSVQGKGYPSLMSAIRWCIRNHSIHWQRIHGSHSIKCAASSETLTAVEGNIRQVKKRMGRTLKLSACVKVDDLPGEEKTKFLAMVAQVGTLAQFASGSTTKALVARHITAAFDPAKTLQLMGGK
jgi:hypothetical protein